MLTSKTRCLIKVYTRAFDAATACNLHFLTPRPVYKNVKTGRDLLRQVEILVPLLWYCEQSKKVREKHLLKLRACFLAMKDEADFVCRAEYLAEFGRRSDLDEMRNILQIGRIKNYSQHEALVQVGRVGLSCCVYS